MSSGETGGGGMVCVANIEADDGVAERVQRVLNEANIAAVVFISHGLGGVQVLEQDRERALRIMEKDAKEHGYWVLLMREVNPEARRGKD